MSENHRLQGGGGWVTL